MDHRIWLQFIFICLSLNQGLCESKYSISFSSEPESCNNFKNEKLSANMVLTQKDPENEGGPGVMCLEGSVELFEDMDESVLINVMVTKDTPAGSEPMMSAMLDLCQCVEDKDTPFAPLVEAMGITKCPLKTGKYPVSELFLELDFLEDMKNQQSCGDYGIQVALQLMPDEEVIACYTMSASMYEI